MLGIAPCLDRIRSRCKNPRLFACFTCCFALYFVLQRSGFVKNRLAHLCLATLHAQTQTHDDAWRVTVNTYENRKPVANNWKKTSRPSQSSPGGCRCPSHVEAPAQRCARWLWRRWWRITDIICKRFKVIICQKKFVDSLELLFSLFEH